MAGNSGARGVSVTARALSLLDTFDEQHRRQTLSQMAGRAGMVTPTAHRLAGELVAWGALAKRPDSTYVVGRRVWDLGLLAPVQTGLRQVASPFLHDIYAATLATVHLAVCDGDQVLYVDRLMGHASVPVVSQIGTRLPMHATGVGKVLLAHGSEALQGQVLAQLTRITPYTITQPGRLRVQLAAVRRQGYATTVEEMSLGACSVAVPIRHGEQVVASLGIVVPTLKRDRPRLVAALQVAASGIGRNL